ncbi:lipopolysaccharide biosynthesis protein [Halalkalibacter sp. APA_J-10(15)]|uniref:lipopolysaccharide biosynthesis protein n=1 Tax=Halalkalibacter sp. APA_J-10(15) TaxID=2933805 RepID=UPI001FF14947|nr:lipopolysaccharide biosynthesis protein [Halalkalibacter sp. APA_J-10(15)]MCK0470090.1 lipopolysaccharide biosynthesis protein [Halalkalibacter sp. APA_J-10(15)]
MNNSLKSKAVKGIKWTSINTVFNSFSYPVYQVILALLLIPHEFAYIAIISLFVTLSVMINNLGVGEAVIQKDNVTSNQLSSLFYFSVIASLILASLMYLLTPFIESYYSLDNLETILKFVIITIVLNGSTSLFRVCLQKNLLFKEYSLIQISKLATDMVVTVIFILLGHGVFGYVYGTVISTALNAILLTIFALKRTEMKILLHFSLKDVMPFLNFGISISLKKILTEVSHRIDEVLIGGMLTPEILGVYFFGKNLIMHLRILITNTFGQVLFPVFSKIKSDIVKMKEVYNKVSYFVAMIAFPIFVGVALTAHLFIPIIFGDEWIGSVSVIRVLSLAMIFLVLTANIATSLLYSVNKPGLVLILDIITTVIYIVSLVLWGENGLLVILSLYSLYIIMKTILLQYFVSKELSYSIFHYVFQMNKLVVSTIIMSIVILGIQTLLTSNSQLLQLIISVISGVITYIIIQLIIDRRNSKLLLNMLLKKV